MLCICGVGPNDSSAISAVNDFAFSLLNIFQYDQFL